jgi:hypothetical protein
VCTGVARVSGVHTHAMRETEGGSEGERARGSYEHCAEAGAASVSERVLIMVLVSEGIMERRLS